MEKDRTLRMLEKLKSQEKKPNPLRLSNELKILNIDDLTKNLTNEQLKIGRILNELEMYEKNVSKGKYLNYYRNLKDKKEEFLQVTKTMDPILKKKAPLFFQKVTSKRESLLKNPI